MLVKFPPIFVAAKKINYGFEFEARLSFTYDKSCFELILVNLFCLLRKNSRS